MLKKYKNKKILILGFEVEGKATFKYLKSKGMQADIADVMPEKEFYQANPEVCGGDFKVILGKDYLESVAKYDLVFRTPGISPLTPELVLAKKKGAELTSQIKFFMDLCPAKTIGVTGTKGKGTTSSLIYEILKASGKDVYLGGNIGVPAISFLDKLKEDSIVVLELSSFQLMDLEKSPDIAVVLNITSEHLDYHKDRKEYVNAKKSIVRYQEDSDKAVINIDYETSRQFGEETIAEVYEISARGVIKKGYSEKQAANLLEELTDFSKYCFNKSHCVSYARLIYITAYLKLHYPEIYMCSWLNHANVTKDRIEYLNECKRLDIPLLQPDINTSGKLFTLIRDGQSIEAIRFGLAFVKDVAKRAEVIVNERDENGKYENLQDFFARVSVIKTEKGSRIINSKRIEALVKAGAFDSFTSDRNLLLRYIHHEDIKRRRSTLRKIEKKTKKKKPEQQKQEKKEDLA